MLEVSQLTAEGLDTGRLLDSSKHTSNHQPPHSALEVIRRPFPLARNIRFVLDLMEGVGWGFFWPTGRLWEKEGNREEPCTFRRPFIGAKQSNQFANRRLQTELLGWQARLRQGSATRAGFTPIHIKGFQGRRERSCERLNSKEGSAMIKANLCIAGQPYKSAVWNSHLRWRMIFQAPGLGSSTCIFGPFVGQME